MLLCQTDSYCRKLTTQVTAVQKIDSVDWVQLQQSIFYPEGGGQPADYGVIGPCRVTDVQRMDKMIWHRLDRSIGLGEVDTKIDWSRRLDHMQQHTGQHMLTALILEKFGWMTQGFHLGQRISTIELETAKIETSIRLEIEQMANRCIMENRAVKAIVVAREEFENMSVRTRGVPAHVEGPIRLIEIDGLDQNTCGGTHVQHTGELQLCKILGTEPIRGRTRLQFIFGQRVVKRLEEAFQREQRLNLIFGQGVEEHVELAGKWGQERKVQSKEMGRLQSELATCLGAQLQVREGIVCHYRPEASSSFCSSMAKAAAELNPEAVVILSGGESGQGVFVCCDPNGELIANKKVFLEAIGGRGGGRPPWIQGKCQSPESIMSFANWLRQTNASG